MYDDDYYEEERHVPEGMVEVLCPSCHGTCFVNCHCGGDLCFCGAEGSECYRCEEGYVYITKEQNEKRIKAHLEMKEMLAEALKEST